MFTNSEGTTTKRAKASNVERDHRHHFRFRLMYNITPTFAN